MLPPLLSLRSAASWSPHRLVFAIALLLTLPFTLCLAASPNAPATAEDEFGRLVTLAPMTVRGESLQIAIFAHSGGDRRYGRKFAESVIEVISETVTPSTGKGLVIVGKKGEPHPLLVFRKFMTLAESDKLDPAIAARAPELSQAMKRWEAILGEDKAGGDKAHEPPDMEFEKIQAALPIPLEGLASKLYQLAWAENFEEAKVEARLLALKPADLERKDLFKRYDWAFYLPPKGAFERVIDDLINNELKKEEVGIVARIFVKGVMLAIRPQLRRAMEGFRQAMLFMTVVQARTPYSQQNVKALTETYVHPFMPADKDEGKAPSGNDRESLIKALKARMLELGLEPVNPR